MASPRAGPPSGTKPNKGHLPEEQRSKASSTMMDQVNFEATRPVPADPAVALAEALGQLPKVAPPSKPKAAPTATVETLAQEHGLKLGEQNELTIRRIKRGKSYSFIRANGSVIRQAGTIRRLNRMAMPPAYRDVRYSLDPDSHLQ